MKNLVLAALVIGLMTAAALSGHGQRRGRVGRGSAVERAVAAVSAAQVQSFEFNLSDAVAFSPDGSLLSAGGQEGVRVWDTRNWQLKHTLVGHTGKVYCVAFSADGRQLATDGEDRTVRIWDAVSGRQIRSLLGHTGDVLSVAFSTDGATLASGARDDTDIRIWDARTGRLINKFRVWSGGVGVVAFSPDGSTMATASRQQASTPGVVRIYIGRSWFAESRSVISPDDVCGYEVNDLGFSPDGRSLVTGCFDGTVKLWQLGLDGHAATTARLAFTAGDEVWAVAYSPDGRVLATGGYDGLVKLWSPATGALKVSLTGHRGTVNALAFSPDAAMLASSGFDGVRVWKIRES